MAIVPEMELTNLTNLTKAKEAPGAADLAIGIVLTLFGAVTLALSMTIQRYALAHPSPIIPYCGLQLKKSWVWGFGLLLYLFANVFKVIGLMFGPMTVLSSVFTTLLIFNLVIANRLLDERITPPKVAGAVLILIGAGLCTTATPEGVPENYTPDDVIELIARPPPFGWFLMVLMASFAGGSLVVMLRVERRFPIRDDTGLIHEEHAIPHAALVVAERRMSIGPGTFLRRPSPLKRQDSSRQHPGEWLRARAIAAQHLEEEEGSEIRLRAERTRTQQIAVGNPRRSWGALSNMSSLSVSFSSIRRPSREGSSRKVLPMGALPETDSCRANEMADGAAPAVPGLAFVPPPLSPTPKNSPPAAKGTALPTTPASATATEKSTPSLREFSKPAPNPNPNPPMPPWLDRLMALLYPASLGIDEALADLCVRGYSSMLATGVQGAVQAWVLYVMVVIGTVAGVLSAVFYMPYVYRRYETTVALPIEYGALNAGNIASGLLFYGEAQYMRPWQVGMALGGCAVILLGIGVGRLERLPCSADPNKPPTGGRASPGTVLGDTLTGRVLGARQSRLSRDRLRSSRGCRGSRDTSEAVNV